MFKIIVFLPLIPLLFEKLETLSKVISAWIFCQDWLFKAL